MIAAADAEGILRVFQGRRRGRRLSNTSINNNFTMLARFVLMLIRASRCHEHVRGRYTRDRDFQHFLRVTFRAQMPPTAGPSSAASASRQFLSNTSVLAPLNINVFGEKEAVARPPSAAPTFTLGDIKKALPARLFVKSTAKSLAYLLRDLVIIAALGAAATQIAAAPAAWRPLLWALYWYAQGCVMTGVWVLAHECGHQSFSPSKDVNGAWRSRAAAARRARSLTHPHPARRHGRVGAALGAARAVPLVAHLAQQAPQEHVQRRARRGLRRVAAQRLCAGDDEGDAAGQRHPDLRYAHLRLVRGARARRRARALRASAASAPHSPPPPALSSRRPAYLAANVAGPAKYIGKPNSHFSPTSALFTADEESVKPAVRRWEIVVSDIGFFGALALIAGASVHFGVAAVCAYYVLPYIVVNANLVLITYLQHTDEYVPHYREKQFTWLRGALSTVDRSFGSLLDVVFHHITDTHVVHHLFSEMPFYHAQEATRLVREFLGPYYLCDHTPVPVALWRAWSACRFVDNEGDVIFFKGAAEFNKVLEKGSKKS